MNEQKKMIIATLVIGSVAFAFADAATPPSVSGVTMTQAKDRLVTVNYTLANGPAVITFDIQTNATANAAADHAGWTSIGGEAVWNAAGDVWKKVTGDIQHTITWRPDKSWPDHKITGNGARAVVTAWALDNTPQYMVVDLLGTKDVSFYPGVDYLPKGLKGYSLKGAAVTNNIAFKTTSLVMRKIEAEGVRYQMGSDCAGDLTKTEYSDKPVWEKLRWVTLSRNYYIGIFEVTKKQWYNVMGETVGHFIADSDTRPVERVKWEDIRDTEYGAAPSATSFLGMLREKTGVDFDLPSEAQWEYACRAGHPIGYWNDGSAITKQISDNRDSGPADANLNALALYRQNRNGTSEDAAVPASEGGTAYVGSYAPSSWGLYDMHGNVWEHVLDRGADFSALFQENESDAPLADDNGTIHRIVKGGAFTFGPHSCRASARRNTYNRMDVGFRVVCPVLVK